MNRFIRLSVFLIFISFVISVSSCKSGDKDGVELEQPSDDNKIEYLSKQIRENPKSPELFAERASLHFEEGNIDEAINDIQIALVLDSITPDYYIKLSGYYLSRGHSGPARDALLKCIKFNPLEREPRLKLAQIYFYVQMYREALLEISFLEQNNLQNDESFFIKGLILLEGGNLQEAIRAFRRTIEYNHNYWQAHNYLGLIHSNMKNALAVEYFETAIRLFPDNLEIRLNAGITFQEFGYPDRAIEQYDYIISVDSLFYNAYFNKAYVYLEYLGEYGKAVEFFNKSLELDVESYPAYYNRGFAYELMGNLDAAESDYRKALEIKPNYDLAVEGLNEVIDKKRKLKQ